VNAGAPASNARARGEADISPRLTNQLVVRSAVIDKFPLEFRAIRQPNAHGIAVAGVGIACCTVPSEWNTNMCSRKGASGAFTPTFGRSWIPSSKICPGKWFMRPVKYRSHAVFQFACCKQDEGDFTTVSVRRRYIIGGGTRIGLTQEFLECPELPSALCTYLEPSFW
jgi:hypothetical protein